VPKIMPARVGDLSLLSGGHIRGGFSRRFPELALFDAHLYIRVRRFDQLA